MTEINSLEIALIEELKDIFSAENQLLKALPKMIKATASDGLKKAFEAHLKETTTQVERLQSISEMLNTKLTGKTCKAMMGLVEESKEALEEKVSTPQIRDLLIVGAALRIEHYEIAAYTHACSIAEKCHSKDVVNLLKVTLEEESKAEKTINKISSSEIIPEIMTLTMPQDRPTKIARATSTHTM